MRPSAVTSFPPPMMPMPEPRVLAMLLAACLLAGCGAPSPQAEDGRRQSAASHEASMRFGDYLARANAVPATRLGDAVARQYGIGTEPGTVLVLIGVRRLTTDPESAVPARIKVTSVNLLGRRQEPEVREVRVGEFIDYVATVRVDAPDTLRFDIEVAVADGAAGRLQFNQDFFPED
jgi:hypothetical protein